MNVLLNLFLILGLNLLVAGENIADGQICGFVDVNFDQYTDLIVNRANEILIFEQTSQQKLSTLDTSTLFSEAASFATNISSDHGLIKSCAVGDFDGDSYPDILVSLLKEDKYTALICFGSAAAFNCSIDSFLWTGLKEQPFIVDINLDGYPDFVTFKEDNNRVCIFGNKDRNKFSETNGTDCFEGDLAQEVQPGFAHAFVDMDGGTKPSVMIGVKDDIAGIVVHKYDYTKVGSGSEQNVQWKSTKIPIGTKHLAPSNQLVSPSFSDFDANGYIDMLIPIVQKDNSTIDLRIWAYSKNESSGVMSWNMHFANIDLKGQNTDTWVPALEADSSFQFRVGDYDNDGYPDLILVAEIKDKGEKTRSLILLKNENCYEDKCSQFSRTFTSMKSKSIIIPPLKDSNSVMKLVTFFDLKENGDLDFLIETSEDGKSRISTKDNTDTDDNTFLKASICTSTCGRGNPCKNGEEGSKISDPGSTLYYEMTNIDNNIVRGRHTLLSQSSHKSLQLPFVIFGLWNSPNFVQELRASIPYSSEHNWNMIVPNSRMYVIPYPKDKPNDWIGRLYITPSRLVLFSFGALCFICGIVLLIILGLQLKESKDDKEEAKLERRENIDLM